MKTALLLLLLLVVASLCMGVAGVYLLAGLAWSLLLGSVVAALAALVIARGMRATANDRPQQ